MGESICFGFSLALPAAGKGVFIFQEPCPSWANVFLFFKSLAHAGQAVYFFISPLPALGKPFIFSFHLCPRWASRLFFQFAFVRRGQASVFLKTLQIYAFCASRQTVSPYFFAQDAVFRFRFAQIQAIASDKRRNFCSLTHESSRISRRRSLLAHHFINFKKPFYCFMIS